MSLQRGPPSWDGMNRPSMKPLEISQAQKDLYHAYGDPFEYLAAGRPLTILAPRDIIEGKYSRCGVVLRAHGGGMTAGHRSSEEFRKAHLSEILVALPVVIELSYPTLPWHSGTEIHSDQYEIHEHIVSGKLEEAMNEHWPKMTATLMFKDILYVGESAGGHLACDAWVAQILPIKVMYLLCPLVSHYERKASHDYRGEKFTQEELRRVALDILITAAKARPCRPQVRGAKLPEFLPNLPLTAVKVPAKRGDDMVKDTTLWSLLWCDNMTLDNMRILFKHWLKNRQADSGTISSYADLKVEETSDIVRIEASEIVKELGLPLLEKLGLRYLPEEAALSYTVPAKPITPPLESPFWYIVHDKDDPYVPIKNVEEVAYMIQLMYGEAKVCFTKLRGSVPLHGFDAYNGHKEIARNILETLHWVDKAD